MKKLLKYAPDRYDEEAVKEAIVLRRNGSISKELDDLLAYLVTSITKWALVEKVQARKITKQDLDDYDFFSTCILAVLMYIDKVDLNKDGKQIIKYLYKVAASAARDQVRARNAKKRRHVEVQQDEFTYTQVADFWGNPVRKRVVITLKKPYECTHKIEE